MLGELGSPGGIDRRDHVVEHDDVERRRGGRRPRPVPGRHSTTAMLPRPASRGQPLVPLDVRPDHDRLPTPRRPGGRRPPPRHGRPIGSQVGEPERPSRVEGRFAGQQGDGREPRRAELATKFWLLEQFHGSAAVRPARSRGRRRVAHARSGYVRSCGRCILAAVSDLVGFDAIGSQLGAAPRRHRRPHRGRRRAARARRADGRPPRRPAGARRSPRRSSLATSRWRSWPLDVAAVFGVRRRPSSQRPRRNRRSISGTSGCSTGSPPCRPTGCPSTATVRPTRRPERRTPTTPPTTSSSLRTLDWTRTSTPGVWSPTPSRSAATASACGGASRTSPIACAPPCRAVYARDRRQPTSASSSAAPQAGRARSTSCMMPTARPGVRVPRAHPRRPGPPARRHRAVGHRPPGCASGRRAGAGAGGADGGARRPAAAVVPQPRGGADPAGRVAGRRRARRPRSTTMPARS